MLCKYKVVSIDVNVLNMYLLLHFSRQLGRCCSLLSEQLNYSQQRKVRQGLSSDDELVMAEIQQKIKELRF